MWNEGNDRHANSPLAHLDKDAALTAAGAACAALVLTGCEAVSLKPSDEHDDNILYVSKLRGLPGGENVRHLVGSRLFCRLSDADEHFRPIHRLIAEFLGARWLAAAAKNDQMRERVLALITCDGGVPASLRGIHAWLPHFDERFARKVIAADPYGLLRYGDADGSRCHSGAATAAIAEAASGGKSILPCRGLDATFRQGLAHEELCGDIRDILLASNTTFHLRTLILEAIRGSAVAATLSDDLHAIMLNEGDLSFSFAEREDAAEAIISLGHGTNRLASHRRTSEPNGRRGFDAVGARYYGRCGLREI